MNVLTRLVDAGGTLGSVQRAFEEGEPDVVEYFHRCGHQDQFVTEAIYQVFMYNVEWTCVDTMQRVVKTLCETSSGYDRKKLIDGASRTSLRVPMLKYFGVKDQPVEVQLHALRIAMYCEDCGTIEYLLDERMESLLRSSSSIFESDEHARWGFCHSVVALLFLSKNLCVALIVRCAVQLRMLDVIRLAHQSGLEGFTPGTMDAAAAAGSLPIVQFLHEHRQEGCSSRAMNLAAAGGYLHVVKFLHEHRDEGCTSHAMDLAAKNGHVRVVKFLHENRREGCTTNAFTTTAKLGHVEVVKYLWQHQNAKANPKQHWMQQAWQVACGVLARRECGCTIGLLWALEVGRRKTNQ